jgi:N-acetylglucosaminyldiphosphoundecaprenol N-acetyl-beta-D-mannosaminyltransferase
MVMEAHDDPAFRDVVNGADLVTPDGVPLVWALRALGVRHASRVYGPDLMLALCEAAEREKIPIGLYGGAEPVRSSLEAELRRRYPDLLIAYAHSPAFGAGDEDGPESDRIRAADVGILFVALGCPRQERWMATQAGRIPAVMVGVGAAFDFLSGSKPQAPRALQKAGLEWAFRLASEPRRLWRRYTIHNPRFITLLAMQLIKKRSVAGRHP